jgi:hypothetical protein
MELQRVSFNADLSALHRRRKPTDCTIRSAVLSSADCHVKKKK